MSLIFKEIPGYEGLYSISACGTVLKHGCKRKNRQGYIHHAEKIVKHHVGSNGYVCAWLINGKKREKALLHRLLAMAFLKHDSGRKFVNHKDGNKRNNDIKNLEWCTPKENVAHASQMGLLGRKKGSTHGHSKLTSAQVLTILSVNKKYTAKQLAKIYSVSKSTIDRINCGSQYKDITRSI